MPKALKTQTLLKKKGYDTGKKISGIKCHIAVDTQGLPHAMYVTTAEATDRSSTVRVVENARENLYMKSKIYLLMLAIQEKILQLK